MHRWSVRAFVVSLSALICAAAATLSMWPGASDVRTEDHNRDGHPDVWREYDRLGRLADVRVDTNFDGRSDVHEYYDRGALVRRESDRDFNDRVDLIQEFDAATRERARSVVDTDFDGTADLLVLFQHGKPVFSKWARHAAPVVARGLTVSYRNDDALESPSNGRLALLQDPFQADSAIRAGPADNAPLGQVFVAAFNGLTVSRRQVAVPLAVSSDLSGLGADHPSPALVHRYPPRGPPASHLLG